jgi:DNA-binding MarR family transcriptional regulator
MATKRAARTARPASAGQRKPSASANKPSAVTSKRNASTNKRSASTKVPPISIETYVPTLITRIALRMIKASTGRFEELDLTIPMWRVLLALAEHRSIRFGQLAKLTRIELPTLSRVLGMMQTAGLVRRRRARQDTRTVNISLTPRGRELFESTIPWALATEQKLLRGLSQAQVETLHVVLARMHENLNHDAEEMDAE